MYVFVLIFKCLWNETNMYICVVFFLESLNIPTKLYKYEVYLQGDLALGSEGVQCCVGFRVVHTVCL